MEKKSPAAKPAAAAADPLSDLDKQLEKIDRDFDTRIEKIFGPKIQPEVLLEQLDGLLRNRPTFGDVVNHTDGSLEWRGRVSAVLKAWNSTESIGLIGIFGSIDSSNTFIRNPKEGYAKLISLLHQARHDLQMQTVGPVNVAVEKGGVFEYFEGLRKIVEAAGNDVLFIDPYIDADFVARYLPHIPGGVRVRLLTRKGVAALLPAVDLFVKQYGGEVQVRSAADLHDRYLIVDGNACYQSGASFKDGAFKAHTTITQITDVVATVIQSYEARWDGAKVER